MARMMLLTKMNRKRLPQLYSREKMGDEAVAYVKFFTPWTSWSWFATEGQPVLDDNGNEIDFRFFGLVYGQEKELGYFTLNDLKSVKGPFGLGIERDRYFKPTALKNCKDPCKG